MTGKSQKLNQKISEVLARPDMQHATFSFYAVSLRSDSVLAAYNYRQSLAPASNMKVITTAAALSVLGADYRFETVLEYEGEIDSEGTLQGNMYIRGGGDPTLGTGNLPELMKDWTIAVQNAGIRRINGAVIGDASIFDNRPMPDKWLWEDMGNYYGAGACGLSIHDNLYYLHLKQGKKHGDPTRVLRTIPVMEDVKFINEVTTGQRGTYDNCYIFGAPYTSLRYLRGTIPAGRGVFVVRGAIPDPALFCAQTFTNALRAKKIDVAAPATTDRLLQLEGKNLSTRRVAFFSTFSAPLRDIVKTTNVKSVNLYAEHLLKMIGYKKYGKGTTEAGIEAVKEIWKTKNLPLDGFFMEDGSGLSRYDAVTTEQMAQMLKAFHKDMTFEALFASLPVAGRSGSLATLCKGTVAENKVHAKSGLLTRVRGYSGYVTAQSGDTIAFSMIANNYSGNMLDITYAFEKLMVAMAEE